MSSLSRRKFLAAAGLGTLLPLRSPAAAPTAEKLGWDLCASIYTFRAIGLYEALDQIVGLGISHIEPAFFLKLDSARPELKTCESLTPELREELKGRLAKKGISMTNFYAKVEADPAANRAIFEYAKEMGVQTIVAEPPAEALDGVEDLCESFAINLAIHNHPNDRPTSKYWNPDAFLAAAKNRGPRIGACPDTGHWVRSGLDPVECLKKLEGHIIEVHAKDVEEIGNPKSRDVPLGTGKANYGAILRELHRQKFKGTLTLEYEHQSPALLDDLRACIDFIEKTAASIG
ncbi:MAG TPA: sugar phosphate isomerase/epimerase family protein [Verrucomicrobiae bacterium]|nr:sugar phosphate isomerase/epimerase family protein [Verrucomicrobiae bacterium]